MIKTFRCQETENLFYRRGVSRFPADLLRRARRKLGILNASEAVSELNSPPGNHLESLKGDRAGQYSIRNNDKYRICFVWREGNAYDVEIADYHD